MLNNFTVKKRKGLTKVKKFFMENIFYEFTLQGKRYTFNVTNPRKLMKIIKSVIISF